MERASNAFGRVLRESRRSRGLTQREVSDRARLDPTTPSLLERGLRSPTLETIIKLEEALELEPGYLVAATVAALRC
jgi:transcriptional regulator with XRE-family HTH domain